MAAGLKVLGIETLSRRVIVESLVTLFFFGFASSGLYDLWKLIPAFFFEGPGVIDGKNLSLCLGPGVFAFLWFLHIFKKYRGLKEPQPSTAEGSVSPHKGIVLVLSNPRQPSPGEIVAEIESCEAGPEELFKIRGIGQLFRGLYHHREKLCYVWPVVTDQSNEYRICIDSFLKKFIPSAKVLACQEQGEGYLVPHGSQQDQIKSTKALLKRIYSASEFERTGLKKSDIIVDITGGPKHITIGLIFGALDSSIDIQYTEQSDNNNVIPLDIDHRIILDKTSDFILELYQQMNSAETPQQEGSQDDRTANYQAA